MSAQQLATANAFSQLSLDLRFDYDYTAFGSEALQRQAKATLSQFFGFVQHTFTSGLEIGRSFRRLMHELCLEHGLSEGEQRFEDWLRSSDFGASTWMARSLIQVSEWFDSQRNRIQKLILKSVQSWSISALKELTKVSDEHLLVKLLKAGKQTVSSIRQARHSSITLGQPVTSADWELVADRFGADDDAIATLQAEAQRLAHTQKSEVFTDHLIEAIETLTEWDVAKLLAPRKTKATPAIASFIANAGEPDEVIEEAQLTWIERGLGLDEAALDQFRSCVRNLAREDSGEDGVIVTRHGHVQQALQLQKLAPVVPQPQQSERMSELERQVRDLSAQLKEADKAAALIHGLQAQRDRLEQENLQLQALVQENAQKDLEIHLLEQQLAEFETSRSDAVLEQLVEQNQQLVIQLEEMQQRYEALASEMAASKRTMKYSDNSTLTAKVMALETQLAEEKARLEQEKQKPQPPASNPQVETYKVLLAQMAAAIPVSPIQQGDRVLVAKPYHPATGEFVTVVSERDSSNFVNIQTDAGATWHICAEDLRLESMLGDQGLDLISATFAAAASKQQLSGWTEKGYRSPYGLFYQGWDAIAQFAKWSLQDSELEKTNSFIQ
ncbi:hypothetical protein [Laspinema palackyanum]|uniref:hypothetical protein n=1 Tax=Laspinema palackyanum TaxID=3231601 RepID=UPI00345D5B0A|nr:hypothetical protein [Laspinema sp. D2c]